MKKSILTAFAALLLAVPAAQAQKVNKEALLAKIEKSNAEVADAKKGSKAATWLKRGKAYYEAAHAPVKDIAQTLTADRWQLALGDPQKQPEGVILSGMQMAKLTYPYLNLYVNPQDGKIITWEQTDRVLEGGYEEALASYNKALELEPKQQEKVREHLEELMNAVSQQGNVYKDLGQSREAGKYYMMASDILNAPGYGLTETEKPQAQFVLSLAGRMFAVDAFMNKDMDSAAKGAECYATLLNEGYTGQNGDCYYYLFYCYYCMKDQDPSCVMKAKEALVEGIDKFPTNQEILKGLIDLYTKEEGIGDPQELVVRLEKTIAEDPQNYELWMGRGILFNSLNNLDESIVSFSKASELKPEMVDASYYAALSYTLKANAILDELNNEHQISAADSDAAMAKAVENFKAAIPFLEHGFEVNPQHIENLTLLKEICFRLRDESDEFAQKFQKYNALWKEASGK